MGPEQGFPLWLAQGIILRGWTLVTQELGEEGIAQMRQVLSPFPAKRAELWRPYWLALLVEVYGKDRQVEEGLQTLAEALALTDRSGESWYKAELHRLKGELLLQQSPDNQTEAETCFHQALSIARNQQAKSLELRAATSLARLWQSQDKRRDTYDVLAPVYEWFTEGFDTADLHEAKALLGELE